MASGASICWKVDCGRRMTLSGGAFGIGLIVLGATFIVVQNSRRDRIALEADAL